ETRLTIGALPHLMFDPGLLQGIRPAVHKTFDGSIARTLDGVDHIGAGTHGFVVDVDCAGAALRNTAAELGAGEPEMIPQNPQKRRRGIDVDLGARAVERECVLCYDARLSAEYLAVDGEDPLCCERQAAIAPAC